MTTALTSFNDSKNNMIELVICNNDGMAEGAISALNSVGYNTGNKNGKSIPVFGVDATAAAIDLISKGKMTGTIKQDSTGLASAVAIIAANSVTDGKSMRDGLDKYNIDKDVFKVRIPYSEYLG